MSYIPTQKTLTIGGRTFTESEITRLESGTLTAGGGIILVSGITTGGRGTSFRKKDGTVFQVGAGVTLKVKAISVAVAGAAGSASYQVFLGSSDAAVTYDTASPGTTPVYYGGASVSPLVATNTNYSAAIDWDVAATKYPFFVCSGGPASVIIYCFID